MLLFSFIALLSFIYVFSISKTLGYKKKLIKLQQEREIIDNSATELKLLKEKSIYLDSILKQENISVTNSFQQIILKKINEFKKENKIELIEFNTSINVLDSNTNIQLYPLIIKGNFNELLSFLNYIEQQGLGEIKNINFLKKKDYRTRKSFLLLKLYIKKIAAKN
ncbi:putative General secretion pathway protein [Tenacibaculum litoreum]